MNIPSLAFLNHFTDDSLPLILPLSLLAGFKKVLFEAHKPVGQWREKPYLDFLGPQDKQTIVFLRRKYAYKACNEPPRRALRDEEKTVACLRERML